jgi:hypothetical protein
MSEKEDLKKQRVMGIRLSERLHELLTQKSEEFEMSKSEILRLSFEFFRFTTELVKDYSMVIVPGTLLSTLFEMASIEKLEETAFLNAKMITNNGKIFCLETGMKFNIESFMKYARKMMSRNTLGFFTKLNFRMESNKSVHLIGLHDINLNFSHYLVYLFKHMMKTFNYTAIVKTIAVGEKSIEIEFRRI